MADIEALIEDVTELKVAVAGMEPYVKQIPKIADSLHTLAEIMPRLEHNMEDHKHIHVRLDNIEEGSSKIEQRLRFIEVQHAACMERNRIEDVIEKDSYWTITKKTAVPILVTSVLVYMLWMFKVHLPEYLATKNSIPTAKGSTK